MHKKEPDMIGAWYKQSFKQASDFTAFPRATLKSYGKVTHPSDSTAPPSDSTAPPSDFTHAKYTRLSDLNWCPIQLNRDAT